MNSSSKKHHYVNLGDKCWLNSLAYHVHKENREKYKGKEKRCRYGECLQYCSMVVLDHQNIEDGNLCYFNIKSKCTIPSYSGLPEDFPRYEQIDIPKLKKEVKEYCLCSSEDRDLDMFHPFTCVCYSHNWDYCLNRNDTAEECNFMRKFCTHRIALPKRSRIDVLCDIKSDISNHEEETLFNDVASPTNLPTAIYESENQEEFTIPEYILTEANTESITLRDEFHNDLGQLKLSQTSSSTSIATPSMFHFLLIFIFSLIMYSEFFRKARLNTKLKKTNRRNYN